MKDNDYQSLRQRVKNGALRDAVRETRWIYRHTRAYRRSILLYTLLGLITTGLSMLSALISKELVNSIVNLGAGGYGGRRVATVGITMSLVALFRIALSAFVSRYSAKINLRVANDLRAEVFRGFLNTDWESLQQYHSGDLLSRINTDVSSVAGSVLGLLPNFIIRLAQFIASFAIILYYDPSMALLALVTAPLSILAARPFVRRMRSLSKELRTVGSEMMSFHGESLQNAQPIKAFNLVDAFRTRLDDVQEKYYDTAMRYNRFSVFNSSLLSAVGLFASYLCLGWGAYRLWCGKIDFATVMLFLQLAGYLSSALSGLIKLIPSAIDCTVSAQRLMAVLELPREKLDGQDEVDALLQADITLQLRNLGFSYHSGKHVLQGIQLTVHPQEMIAIVGPSGSGKTTLFRILLALLQPTEGSVQVTGGGHTLSLCPATRRLFSYVPQDNVIFSGSIAETLRLVRPEASDEEIYAALRAACAEDFVRSLPDGIYSELKERGSTLSEGQNQRLAIARAFLADAPILLLDEVTSALDLDTERQVLRNIAARSGKTCIISTHRPSVLSLCDHVYRIRGGRLEELTQDEVKQLIL